MSDPLRILLVNDYGVLRAGAEIAVDGLRTELRARGHIVRLFSSTAAVSETEISVADDHCLGTTSRFRTLLQSANPWAAAALRRVLAAFRPDVVHLNIILTQLSPLILRELRGVPCVYHAHWQRAICPAGTRLLPDGSLCRNKAGIVCYREGCLPLRDWAPLMLQLRLWKRWHESIDCVVAQRGLCVIRLMESGIQDIEVIHYGVPDCPPRPPLDEPPCIVFAGRLVHEKGVEVLLRAFHRVLSRVPDARLQIAGEGPAEGPLRALAGELGVNASVTFNGKLSRSEVERRFAGAWAQVAPSVWEEPFGLVAVEAAMRGTAVVASDIGGLPETVVTARLAC